ncbi:MAG TPA: glycosyl hydrolase family 28-related protein [Acidimicrobiales bacterium]|nr:glycosyl hydrolase family 28-related protein [Acidimicrobiales bacterium]
MTGPGVSRRATLALAGAASAAALVGCTTNDSARQQATSLPVTPPPLPAGINAAGGLVGFVDVKEFGAVGDGTVDDTEAIQKAIDACIGSGDPAKAARAAVRGLYLSPGQYRVTAPLRITSVQGFYLTGAGVQVTSLIPAGSKSLPALLDINGCAEGWFGNFGVNAGGHQAASDKVIFYHWDKATAARSSTGCTFSNISIREVKFDIGFAIGTENHLQVDGTNFYSCLVTGQFKAGSDAESWQYGFKFGNGVSGNNIDHSMFGSAASHCKTGLWFGGSNAWVFGGQPADNEVDVHIESPSVFTFQGLRSEGARRFLSTAAGTAGALIAIRDLIFVCNELDDDGYWIDSSQAGSLTLENVGATNVKSGNKARIRATGRVQVVVTNVLQPTAIDEGLVAAGGAKFIVIAYNQSDSDNRIVAGAQLTTKG